MKLIFIPGLGYDQRIFKRLQIDSTDSVYLDWIEPEHQEPIRNYTKRLIELISHIERNDILIGHSFGGLISQEIAAIHEVEKIILISSVKSRRELPLFFRQSARFGLHHLFTKERMIKSLPLWGPKHGFASAHEQVFFKEMLDKHSNHYLQWALKALSNWQTPILPSITNIVHIHGTHDLTLPYRLIQNPDYTIKKGDHLMVYNRANEISNLVRKVVERSATSK